MAEPGAIPSLADAGDVRATAETNTAIPTSDKSFIEIFPIA